MTFKFLDLLERAAHGEDVQGLTFYGPNDLTKSRHVTYKQLYALAQHRSSLLKRTTGINEDAVVLIHLDDHLDSIVWFWAVVYANAVPALSIPFSKVDEQRLKHIEHLGSLLDNPVCLTRKHLLGQFEGQTSLKVQVIDELEELPLEETTKSTSNVSKNSDARSLAMLLLTSGSTGNSKAVVITHEMIHAALSGKLDQLQCRTDHKSILNWIGFDHVAAWESHLMSLFVRGEQVHVHAPDLIADPLWFLRLIAEHKICQTFAPNFFLSKLEKVLASAAPLGLDLSCLKVVISGGEANVLETCRDLQHLLQKYGARGDVIAPAFGMTETFAGSIHNLQILEQDAATELFAGLGRCIPGMEMRIVVNEKVAIDNIGELQVRGKNVFQEYYRNTKATASSFTADGWFKTGDQGLIDGRGRLYLTGRTKETVMVNAIKYSPHEIESAIDLARIAGVTPGCTFCFSYQNQGKGSESLGIIFLPSYTTDDAERATQTYDAIVKAVIMRTGVRPYVLPLDSKILQRSALGKLPRSKLKAGFESGTYESYHTAHEMLVRRHRSRNVVEPRNEVEKALREEISTYLEIPQIGFGIDIPFFDIGITSLELLGLKSRIEIRLSKPVSVGTLLQNMTIRTLAHALTSHDEVFSPVVILQAHGSDPPLWLVHPGDGDVLVYFELAKRLDRPVYALRARGLGESEAPFSSIEEAAKIYQDAIKSKQPHGPYAIASHCYGAMLAFETSKLLEAEGEEVRFLGAINLPPHIKYQMQQLDWVTGLVHLAYFIGLLDERYAESRLPELRRGTRTEALKWTMSEADQDRWRELAMSEQDLYRWADVAYELHAMACDYEPTCNVQSVDVLYAEPLRTACDTTKEEWAAGPLSEWQAFSRQRIQLHECPGGHHSMIGTDYVKDFGKVLSRALKARGL
ncbi:hypothetical protein MMC10_009105 [Thelotrema lepadinum]|nr:hypothetical protein [Thelotrema lepadinum]